MSRTRPDSGFSENASPPCGTRDADSEDVGRPAGRTLEDIDRDEEGFFLDPADWHAGLVEPLASECGIEMSDEHRLVVDFVRAHFEQYESVPEARVLLRYLGERLGPQRATRRHLYTLFPYGYGQQACKIAGMRKPRKLMLDV